MFRKSVPGLALGYNRAALVIIVSEAWKRWISVIMHLIHRGQSVQAHMCLSVCLKGAWSDHMCPSQQQTRGPSSRSAWGPSGLPVPSLAGRQGRRASLWLSCCPLISITFLINVQAFSAAHLQELPTFPFSFWLQKHQAPNEETCVVCVCL